MVDVRETLLIELEALIEARARRRVVRQGARSEQSLQAAVDLESSDLAYVLWKLLDEHQGR